MSRCVTRCIRHFKKKSSSVNQLFKLNSRSFSRSLLSTRASKQWLSTTRSKSTLYALYHLNNHHRRYLQFTRRNYGTTDPTKPCTFVVGMDGTDGSYHALEHAYRLARSHDKIIALHIPWDLYQYANEQLVFSTGLMITKEQRKQYEDKREYFISRIESQVNEINEKLGQIHINKDSLDTIDFEFMVTDDSVSVKTHLVEKALELKCDYLVVGATGYAHSLRESVEKQVTELLGSVPDYCVHNAHCSVLVVKSA